MIHRASHASSGLGVLALSVTTCFLASDRREKADSALAGDVRSGSWPGAGWKYMCMLGRLGLAQRIVIVVALALILGAVGVYVTTLGGPAAQFGWFGYAPLTRATFGPDLSPWEQLLVCFSVPVLNRPAEQR